MPRTKQSLKTRAKPHRQHALQTRKKKNRLKAVRRRSRNRPHRGRSTSRKS
jgi:hypothetical protein